MAARADPNGLSAAEGLMLLGTPLHVAIAANRADNIAVLLQAGADINRRHDSEDCTPLLLAVELGRANIVNQLLAAGADPNSVTIFGRTPLQSAAMQGRLDLVSCLVQSSASIDEAAEGDKSPLFLALEGGHDQVAQFLVKSGAVFNPAAGSVFKLTVQTQASFYNVAPRPVEVSKTEVSNNLLPGR